MRRIPLVLLALAAAPGFAQDPLPLAPPLLGYAYDPLYSRILRVSGVPGAALFDGAIAVEPRVAAVFVAPAGAHAIAAEPDQEPLLLRWPEGRLTMSPLPGGLAEPSVVYSASGSTAALHTGPAGLVQVWTGLPAAPRLAAVRHMGFDGVLTAIAVSEQGDVAAGITIAGYSMALLLGEGSGRVLASGGRFSALAFSPDSSELLAADAEQDQVWVLQTRSVNPSPKSVASKPDGVDEPVAAAWSYDGSRKIIAERDGKVLEIDGAGVIRTADCECRIDGLHRLAGNSVFRLVDPPKGRTPVFDGDAEAPRIVYLPMEVEQ